MTISSNLACRLAIGGLLAVHACLLAINARWMSPTLDESAHVVAGISHWRLGDFSLYRVNPPLIRSVAVLPILLAGYEMDFPEKLNSPISRSEFQLGSQFMNQNGRRSFWLVTLGRWACLPFSLLAAVTCYLWGRDLYGRRAGLLACALWCFSPMVLGHAALLTPDAHAAALGLLACYTFWLWLQQPTWQRTITTGVVLGLAELAKITLILFYPLWPVIWIVYRWPERKAMNWRRWRNEGLMLASRMLIGLYVVNLGYLGMGSFVPLKEYVFRSELFGAIQEQAPYGNRFQDSLLGEIPVPLPYDYVLGIDHQQRDFERFWGPSYLAGQLQDRGWWYYYLYALMVKAPLGTLLLLPLVLCSRAMRMGSRPAVRDELVLLAPAVFVFVVVSSKTGFSHHLRYVFPCLPLVFVWLSQVAELFRWPGKRSAAPAAGASDEPSSWGRCGIGWLGAACVGWMVCSSLGHYPHSLAYFNELAGGPRRGAEHLLNSNLDWGQDLLHLERWIRNRDQQGTVFLAFESNNYNPFVMEIEYIEPWPLRREDEAQSRDGSSRPDALSEAEISIPEGCYAIGTNLLYEYPRPATDRDDSKYFVDTRPLHALRSMEPIGWAGYSIRIFSAGQLRQAYERLRTAGSLASD